MLVIAGEPEARNPEAVRFWNRKVQIAELD